MTRHCGRTRQVYRWRLTYASPRGVELEEGFLLSYAAALRDAGDLVVYVGERSAEGRQAATTCVRELHGRGRCERRWAKGSERTGSRTLDDVQGDAGTRRGGVAGILRLGEG